MKVKHMRKLKMALFLVPLFVFVLFLVVYATKVKAATKASYKNMNGNVTYCLNTVSATYPSSYYFLGIKGEQCATNSENVLIDREYEYDYYNSPSANIRFIFEYHYNTLDGNPIYKIVSPLDMEGCITVKNTTVSVNNPVYYMLKDDSKNEYQNWLVKDCGNDKYQIVLEKHQDYALAYDDGKCFINKTTYANTYFNFVKVLNTNYEIKTILTRCDSDYEFDNSNATSRILNPLRETGTGRISKMFSIGINAEKTYYNGVDAFYVNPTLNDKIIIKINGTYSKGKYYSEDDIIYGMSNGYTYVLNNDDNTILGKRIGKGGFLIETSDDNINFTKYLFNNYESYDLTDEYTLSSNILSSGKYIRISYLFQLKAGGERLNICEASDTFYVCYNGFGENDFGVISINYNDANINGDIKPEELDLIKKGQTLKDGGIVIDGFSIDKVIDGYTVEIKHNDDDFIVYPGNKKIVLPGKYVIRVKSKLGSTKLITIYNLGKLNENQETSEFIKELYFGDYYKDSNETGDSFLSGNRILSGSSDYFDQLGIKLPYSWVNVPVFLKGCKYRINNTKYYPKLSGIILRENNGEIETTDFETIDEVLNGKFEKAGYYTISLKTSNDTGYFISFTIKFLLVNEEVGPYINELLIKSKSQEIYDLKPIYYAVDVECGKYVYKDENGLDVEKQGIITYAFSTYENALAFALKYEKKYAIKLSTGYTYKHCDYIWEIDEYDLYKLMLENAKKNVKKSFFSKENEIIYNSISVEYNDDNHSKDNAYQLSFNSTTNWFIVTNSLDEREALTDRQPFINNYEFINVDIDSSSIEMINTDTDEHYNIEYDSIVSKQLENQNASTGKYKVIEENCHGIKNEYYVYYISETDESTIVVSTTIDGIDAIINKEKNGNSIKANSFIINKVNCEYDKHCLIYIRHGNLYEAYDSNDLETISIGQKGIYEIKFVDRLGNRILINLEIE